MKRTIQIKIFHYFQRKFYADESILVFRSKGLFVSRTYHRKAYSSRVFTLIERIYDIWVEEVIGNKPSD